MINTLLKWYDWAAFNRRRTKNITHLLFGIVKPIANECCQTLIPLSLKLSKEISLEGLKSDGSTPNIIVSLTSFPARINKVWIVIELLFRQSIRPNIVVLYLSKHQFESVESLPKSLRQLMSRGLEVRFIDVDMRSHNKYHYAMREFPNDIIVTVDDDNFYPNNILEALMAEHREYPDAVVANRVRTLSFDDEGKLKDYNRWKTLPNSSNYNYLQTGVGGVLYPPPHSSKGGLLYKDLLDKELAMRLTPAGDDLWLFAMTRLNDRKVIKTPLQYHLLGVRFRDNVKLRHENCARNFNDEQIARVREYYVERIGVDPFSDRQ